jgi:hypothetical protein
MKKAAFEPLFSWLSPVLLIWQEVFGNHAACATATYGFDSVYIAGDKLSVGFKFLALFFGETVKG